jgi:UDP-N-acetylglucosamine 2-epimerase
MKILTIIGARPQFIKCAPVSAELRRRTKEVLVHTGQHYDDGMSAVFFRQLEIPRPDYHLGAGSGPHGQQTGRMLERLERVILKEKPDAVLVYGDTNSTLAGALAAAKLHVPVAHVEAGLRSFNRRMPEEVNRVLTDHVSSWLFCPTPTATANLRAEGVRGKISLVGDVMVDALLRGEKLARRKSRILARLGLKPRSFFLATIHRAENTDNLAALRRLFAALRRLSREAPVVLPLHPRTRRRLPALGAGAARGLILQPPLPYLDMLALQKNARAVLTDSGGVQKEACWLGTPCVTLRAETEWLETVASGWNTLAGTDPTRIVRAALRRSPPRRSLLPRLGASKRVVAALIAALRGKR